MQYKPYNRYFMISKNTYAKIFFQINSLYGQRTLFSHVAGKLRTIALIQINIAAFQPFNTALFKTNFNFMFLLN